MNFDLKVGKAVQLLLLAMVCLGGYALIADTHHQSTKGTSEVREALGAGDDIMAELCDSLRKSGVKSESCE